MMHFLNPITSYHQLIIALGLGLLVGLQREWAESPIAGIRSYSLVSLLGTTTAILSDFTSSWIIVLGFLGTLGVTINSRQGLTQQNKEHRSLISEISLIIMYFIGVMVKVGPILLAASIAGILAFILHIKLELHEIANRFNKNEIRSIMQFIAVSLVIFPIIPNTSLGPNGEINFHNIWQMVIIIIGVSLLGYIIYKFKGQNHGLFWGGLLGGIISSTATTFSYSRISKNSEKHAKYYSLIILIAWASLYLRVFLELKMVAPKFNVSLPLLILLIVSLTNIFFKWRKLNGDLREIKIDYNPTSLKTALIFALFYFFILYFFTFFKSRISHETLSLIAFISGILDVDAITLSTGRLFSKGVLSEQEAHYHFFLALLANTALKGLLTLIIGGKMLFKIVLVPWFLLLVFSLMIILNPLFL